MVQEYGQIGNSLRQRDVQYIANKDIYGVWRILDTWHQEMAAMTLTDELDIPDDSDAVLIIKEGQFLALMKEVEQQEYMPSEKQLFEVAYEGSGVDQGEEIQELLQKSQELLKERDQLAETLQIYKNETSTSSLKHERTMRVLEIVETMSNKGNLEIDIATLLKSIGE